MKQAGKKTVAAAKARSRVSNRGEQKPRKAAAFSDRSRQDQIVDALGAEIVRGTYPPGANLPLEAELMLRFGVSRSVLREVLKTLAAKGLVVSKTKVGRKVRPHSDWNFFDADLLAWKVRSGLDSEFREHLSDMRRAVEPYAARLAARRRTAEDLARLRGAIVSMSNPQHSRKSFAEADLALHVALCEASGNPMMRSVAAVIEAALLAAFSESSPMESSEDHVQSVTAHAAIVDAIAARDEDAAAAAMLEVIEAGMRRTTKKRLRPKARKTK